MAMKQRSPWGQASSFGFDGNQFSEIPESSNVTSEQSPLTGGFVDPTTMAEMMGGATWSPGYSMDALAMPQQSLGYSYGDDDLAGQQSWQSLAGTGLDGHSNTLPWSWTGAEGLQPGMVQAMVPDNSGYGMMPMSTSMGQLYTNPLYEAQHLHGVEETAPDDGLRGKRRKSTPSSKKTTKPMPKPKPKTIQQKDNEEGRPAKPANLAKPAKPAKQAKPAKPAKLKQPSSASTPAGKSPPAPAPQGRRRSTKSELENLNNDNTYSGGHKDNGEHYINMDSDGSEPHTSKHSQREQNRVAATKCRVKTKAAVNKLEEDEKLVRDQRAYLTAMADRLRNEVLFLKSELLRHGDCDCVLIQQYLARTAKLISQGSTEVQTLPTDQLLEVESSPSMLDSGQDEDEDDDDEEEEEEGK